MDVSKIDGAHEPFLNRPGQDDQRRRRTDQVRQNDKVNISPEAQKAAEIARLVSLVKQIPDIRPDKVAQARARIEAQVSQDENVTRSVVQRLLDDLL